MPHGMPNYGNTCYLNAVLQSLKPLVNVAHAKCSKKCMLLFLLHSNVKAIVGNLFKINKLFKLGRQQDAHEFLRYFVASLEQCSSTGKEISSLFAGKLLSSIVCLTCKKTSTVNDPFMDISLHVQNCPSLGAALKQFSSSTLLSGSNQYRCSSCSALRDAKKRISIYIPPKVLVLHLKRFKFQNGFSKLNHHVAFTADLKVSGSLYLLTAVLVHSGHSCNSGHYYAFVKYDSWYRLDDSSVSKVDEKTVLSQNAYILFYSKTDGQKHHVPFSHDTANILSQASRKRPISAVRKAENHQLISPDQSPLLQSQYSLKSSLHGLNQMPSLHAFQNSGSTIQTANSKSLPQSTKIATKIPNEDSMLKCKNRPTLGHPNVGILPKQQVASSMPKSKNRPILGHPNVGILPKQQLASLNSCGAGKWKLSSVINNVKETKSEAFDHKQLNLSNSPKFWDHVNKNDIPVRTKLKRKRPSKEEILYNMPRRAQKNKPWERPS
jgi:hypothetical protein